MRRDAFDEAGEAVAEDVVADIPATPAELAAELPEGVQPLLDEVPALADEVEALDDGIPEELGVDDGTDTASALSALLPDHLAEPLD